MWKFLSYPLDGKAFGYGDGDRFELKFVRSMCCGDTSNNSVFTMPTHYGTHIDFPFHFSDSGKRSTDYTAGDFVFDKVGVIDISGLEINDYLIQNKDLNLDNISSEIDLLLVKTGFCNKRNSSEYWEKGYGFHKETAPFLKQHFPNLRAIAFDLISLNSYQQREHGREAHKAYLTEQNILIIEEVDLREVDDQTKFKQLIVSPLYMDQADGAPCTILADIDEN
ncbi:MAG: cyclase family protein [Crocinitomicaceae bacterium]|nr:cyclase family protein [Crocinitomicaceae bacterium]